MKYLGIDWGLAKTGLAVGDDETNLAVPFGVVNNFVDLIKIIEQEKPKIIVIGKPYSLLGREANVEVFSLFLDQLKAKTKIRIELMDERLTTKLANRLSGNIKTKAKEDAIAAMIILQNFLDKKKYGSKK